MHLELPLEQLFRRRGKGTQLPFATEAMERVPRRNDIVATPSPLGLHVLAKDEEALEVPAVTLRETYGKDLDIVPPRVRLIEGVRVEEPIMRYEAPLADLLGLPEELDRLTGGTAMHWMMLSHYTHVNRGRRARRN